MQASGGFGVGSDLWFWSAEIHARVELRYRSLPTYIVPNRRPLVVRKENAWPVSIKGRFMFWTGAVYSNMHINQRNGNFPLFRESTFKFGVLNFYMHDQWNR